MKKKPGLELKGSLIDGRFEIIDDRIGEADYNGNFGDGKFAIDHETGLEVFIKTIGFGNPNDRRENESSTQQLERELTLFNHERRILEICLNNNLKRIAKMVSVGEVDDEEGRLAFAYLVFEKASSDGRLENLQGLTDRFSFIVQLLKDVTLGLQQLHLNSIAHQDIKPSNILRVHEGDTERGKITDLGRASIKGGEPMEHDLLDFACQGMYAAPDRLYREPVSDWELKRVSGDLYMLGSLVWQYLMSSGKPLSWEWLKLLEEPYKPSIFSDTYDQVLPYLIDIFSQIFDEARERCETDSEAMILDIVEELTNPNPRQRGARSFVNRRDRYSLEPFISRLDRALKIHQSSLRLKSVR